VQRVPYIGKKRVCVRACVCVDNKTAVVTSNRLSKASLLSRCSPRYLTSPCGSCALIIWTGGHLSLMVNVTLTVLDPLAFILHFLNQVWIASRLVCSLYEAMAGSLPVASTAVSSAKVAVADSGEVGPRTLPWDPVETSR
jgi:hypothetical protein